MKTETSLLLPEQSLSTQRSTIKLEAEQQRRRSNHLWEVYIHIEQPGLGKYGASLNQQAVELYRLHPDTNTPIHPYKPERDPSVVPNVPLTDATTGNYYASENPYPKPLLLRQLQTIALPAASATLVENNIQQSKTNGTPYRAA